MSRDRRDRRDSDKEPVELNESDRRGLYQLLEGDIPARLRRIEFGGIALTLAVASPKVGGPSVHEVAGGLIHFLF